VTEFVRIRDDVRTWPVIDDLFGEFLIGDECVFTLFRGLMILKEEWESFSLETPDERKERRNILADEMTKLSVLIKKDPEANHFCFPDHDQKEIFFQNGREVERMAYFTLTECLNDAAESLRSDNLRDLYNPSIAQGHKSRGTNEKTTYMIRKVVWIIDVLLKQPPQFPNTATATLVNVVLNIPHHSSNKVTAEQIRERVRTVRKENTV